MDRYIQAPISKEDAASLRAGDYVYLTGTIYTARDAAHKRMQETLEKGEDLPVSMDRNIIYYMGPSPAREGRPIGSAGPTTASRMDKYAPNLLDLGLGAMIGKGKRSQAVIDAIVRNGSVYFAAIGGAGALLSKCILSSEVIAYDDLGTEAIRKLEVKNFPGTSKNEVPGNCCVSRPTYALSHRRPFPFQNGNGRFLSFHPAKWRNRPPGGWRTVPGPR